jgi:hypothetical protein
MSSGSSSASGEIGVGLRNLGNTCFMNTVLQCLAHTPPVFAYMRRQNHGQKCLHRKNEGQNGPTPAKFCSACALEQLVNQMYSRGAQPLSPKLFADNLKVFSKAIQLGRQEDAHEFLRCLLDNAVAFTERGAVRVRVDGGEGRMRIEVIDTGVGIAPALQRKIFEPFTQVHDGLNRTHQGVGLGLAVARRIANALGGTIEVTSALGAGSTFTLSLVYEAVSAGEALVDAPVAAQVLTPLELPPHPAGAMETLDVPPLASVTPLTVRVTPRASVPAGPVANVTPLGPVTVTPVVPSASADPRPFEERRSAPPDRAADRGPGERSADSNPPRRSFPPPPPEPTKLRKI